jgi:small subunit ribosomal protein S6
LKEYETVFVLHPRLEDTKVEEEIEAVRQVIEGSSGAVLDVERWGRRKLAYEVGKVNEGIYTLVRFRSAPTLVAELERRYRLKEDVLDT